MHNKNINLYSCHNNNSTVQLYTCMHTFSYKDNYKDIHNAIYSTSTLNNKEHSDAKLSQLKCVATLVLYNIHNNQRTGKGQYILLLHGLLVLLISYLVHVS